MRHETLYRRRGRRGSASDVGVDASRVLKHTANVLKCVRSRVTDPRSLEVERRHRLVTDTLTSRSPSGESLPRQRLPSNGVQSRETTSVPLDETDRQTRPRATSNARMNRKDVQGIDVACLVACFDDHLRRSRTSILKPPRRAGGASAAPRPPPRRLCAGRRAERARGGRAWA